MLLMVWARGGGGGEAISRMTEDAKKTTGLWKDSYLAYIPLLGAALALTFDVGYFFALNLSFFTLFSLSEHILFAIQAFPIALGIILFSLITAGIFLNLPFPQTPSPVPPSKQLHGLQLIIAVAFLTLLAAGLIFLLFYLLYSTPIMTPLTIEILMGLGGLAFINDPYRRAFIATVAVLFLLTFSFFVGYLFAASATTAAPNNLFQLGIGTINLKNGTLITGRIIGSGDRGVLIYDPASNRLRFLLLEGIQSIEAQPREAR
jgi:hypothetical protein